MGRHKIPSVPSIRKGTTGLIFTLRARSLRRWACSNLKLCLHLGRDTPGALDLLLKFQFPFGSEWTNYITNSDDRVEGMSMVKAKEVGGQYSTLAVDVLKA